MINCWPSAREGEASDWRETDELGRISQLRVHANKRINERIQRPVESGTIHLHCQGVGQKLVGDWLMMEPPEGKAWTPQLPRTGAARVSRPISRAAEEAVFSILNEESGGLQTSWCSSDW